jgi:hypothetical protein
MVREFQAHSKPACRRGPESLRRFHVRDDGQDWAEVLRPAAESDTVWTVTEEGGRIWIVQDCIANRLGHLLTECPWQPGVEYIVDEHGMLAMRG